MKWYTYLLCFILIVVGVFCGIQLYKEIKAESYVNGSINIENEFIQEQFNYSSTSLVFYHDIYDTTNTYLFEKDLLKVKDFNGLEKEYQIMLNDFVLINSEIGAGSITSDMSMDFYDVEGKFICNANMKISIVFLSSKTELKISTDSKESASFLEQYFSDNGIRLQVVELL